MKNIALVILAVAVIMAAIVNVIQGSQISELKNRTKCLERDKFYVGNGFCAEKPLNRPESL